MNLLQPYLSDALVEALGWTFLHSLWIGALLSAVFLAVRWVMRGVGAQRRYLTGLAFLALMPVMVLIAFYFSYQSVTRMPAPEVAAVEGNVFHQTTSTGVARSLPESASATWLNEPGWLTSLKTSYFDRYHSALVALWLLGVAVFSARNIGGYFYTGRLRRVGLVEPGAESVRVFRKLMERSGVSRAVVFMESLLVQAPVVVGYFKPVILFPVGLATGLGSSELEAILAHEIAHIRRHDFLVNILQCCVEVLFFYHPAAWLIGAAIREERENCCDDLAISASGDRVSLAKALTHVEAWKLDNNLVLGFSGRNHSLLNRIKRIINNKTMKAQHREGNLLAIGIVAGLCLSTLTALKSIDYRQVKNKEEASEQAMPEPPAPVEVPASETLPEEVETPSPVSQEAPPADTLDLIDPAPAVLPAPKVSADVAPAGLAVPPYPPVRVGVSADVRPLVAPVAHVAAVPGTYGVDMVRAVLAPVPAVRARPAYYGAGMDTIDWNNPSAHANEDLARHMRGMAEEMAMMQAQMASEMAERAAEMGLAAQHMAEHQQEMAAEMAEHQREMAEEMAKRHKEMAERHHEMAMEFSEGHEEEMRQHREEMMKHQQEIIAEQRKMMQQHEQDMRKMEAEMKKHEEKMKAFEADLKRELIKDGIISSSNDRLRLKINGRELYINGEKQPENVYNKYRKFIREKLGDGYGFEAGRSEELNLSFSY